MGQAEKSGVRSQNQEDSPPRVKQIKISEKKDSAVSKARATTSAEVYQNKKKIVATANN